MCKGIEVRNGKLIVDSFNVIAFIRKKGTSRKREKTVCAGQNAKGDRGIDNFCSRSGFINGKPGKQFMLKVFEEAVKSPIRRSDSSLQCRNKEIVYKSRDIKTGTPSERITADGEFFLMVLAG